MFGSMDWCFSHMEDRPLPVLSRSVGPPAAASVSMSRDSLSWGRLEESVSEFRGRTFCKKSLPGLLPKNSYKLMV
jgi:hypothetical protein